LELCDYLLMEKQESLSEAEAGIWIRVHNLIIYIFIAEAEADGETNAPLFS
jgi:hypothetical protein